MNGEKLLQRMIMILCIFVITHFTMMLILNLNIPLGGEWTSVCKEWIQSAIG